MSNLPKLIRDLPKFAGPFDAHKLEAARCDVLFASYPAGTVIAPHQHDTENVDIITKGTLMLTIAGKEKTFVAGERYHIPREQNTPLGLKRNLQRSSSGFTGRRFLRIELSFFSNMEPHRSKPLLGPSALTCPLCGGSNNCAPASSGGFEDACWCETASFGTELLARLPLACRGVSCICAACASLTRPGSSGEFA